MSEVEWHPEDFMRKLDRAVTDGLAAVGADLASYVAETKLSGNPLDVRTGALRRSMTFHVTDEGDTVKVGTNIEYAKAHEFGAIITPKEAQALAIPIGPHREQSRTPRFAKPGDVPKEPNGLFQIKRAGRPPILARKGPNGSIEPMFVLTKMVVIPARPFLRPSLHESIGRLGRIFSQTVRSRLQGGG